MRRSLLTLLLAFCGACRAPSTPSYLFLWAGDSASKASDFLAVIDANPSSEHYGAVVASIPTGEIGTHPHHTEQEMPANGHLLANGFHAGKTWLFDLTQPLHPAILTSFGDVAGFSHPHTYVRLANGHVLATFQYRAQPGGMPHDSAGMGAMKGMPGMSAATSMTKPANNLTGGLVEMDERGTLLQSSGASDTTIGDTQLFPYSVLPLPAIDRAVSTTTDMDEGNTKATSEWLQFWRLSDLKLLHSIALKPGPRGDEHKFTGEPRLLPDGKSIYIHTFNCGVYLLRGVGDAEPTTKLVMAFQGKNCGVPLLVGHYWLQPVPDAHALVAMDITNPEAPREVSRVTVGDDEQPHWIAVDAAGRRVVMNSAGGGKGNRLFVINVDQATGRLSLDERFRDAGSTTAGITLTGRTWPHGFAGTAVPHGTVFSR